MEKLIDIIEAHCEKVTRTAAAAETVVDHLRNGLTTVIDRSKKVKNDVQIWETALKNVVDTQEELEAAASSYAMPRYIDAVVRGEITEVHTLVKALVHLASSKEYLEQKPSNDVGDRLMHKVEDYLDRACERTQHAMHDCVAQTIRPAIGSAGEALPVECDNRRRFDPTRLRMFRDDWQRRTTDVYQAIEQLAIAFNDLKAPTAMAKTCQARIEGYLKDAFNEEYVSKYEGFEKASSSAGGAGVGVVAGRKGKGVAGLMAALWNKTVNGGEDLTELVQNNDEQAAMSSTYTLGDHPLIQISRDGRQLVAETLLVFDEVVLKAFPMSEDDPRYHKQIALESGSETRSSAYGIPSEVLFMPTAQIIFNHVTKALEHVARSPEVGIFDAIFTALDLLSEIWQWRRAARACPGRVIEENAEYEAGNEYVDDAVDKVMDVASKLASDYSTSKGSLDPEELIKSTASSDYFHVTHLEFSPAFMILIGVHSRVVNEDEDEEDQDDDEEKAEKAKEPIPRSVRCRWLPSYDCSVHPSTTGMMRYFKCMFTSFESIFRIALCGSCDEADKMLATMRKERAKRGAGALDWSDEIKEYFSNCIDSHRDDLRHIADAASVTLNPPREGMNATGDDPLALFNRHVFLANNFHFVHRSLTADEPFTLPKNAPLCSEIADTYGADFEEQVTAYAEQWKSCFPNVDDPVLSECAESEDHDLKKPQRAALKRWHLQAKETLSKMVHVSRAHVVAQAPVRQRLSEVAALAVKREYELFEQTVVKGRVWTTQLGKYFLGVGDETSFSLTTTVDYVSAIFPVSSSRGGGGFRPTPHEVL